MTKYRVASKDLRTGIENHRGDPSEDRLSGMASRARVFWVEEVEQI